MDKTKWNLYEFCVWLKPTRNEEKSGTRPRIAVRPTTVIAKSEDEVRLLAAQAIPEDCKEFTDRLEVAVRLFC